MPRNQEAHFSVNPSVNIGRSRMEMPFGNTFDFQVGQLIPFMCTEILPGDSVSMDTSKVVRMSTLLDPVFGTLYLDTYYFFVPMRLIWDHTREFFGENTQGPWYPETTYTIPQIKTTGGDYGNFKLHSVADYLGLPVEVSGLEVNALPFRGYGLIYDEWFRDQNLQAPIDLYKGDTTQSANMLNGCLGGYPYVACKLHDYFTSALPSPQRGPAVQLPLTGTIPVSLGGTVGNVTAGTNFHTMINALQLGNSLTPSGERNLLISRIADQDGIRELRLGPASAENFESSWFSNLVVNWPSDVTANLSGASPITINDLRMAFATQKWYELSARFGGRYIEYLKAHFGVNAGDSRLQRSEYLGGNRVPINVQQVEATVSQSGQPLGHLGAYSHTSDYNSDGTWSFVEHGYLYGICVARYPHVYHQGIHQMFSRKSVFQFYDPLFANLGEMPILEKEIYAQGTAADDNVFGYQEAWSSYRYLPDRVSGCMRPGVSGSLASWNYADLYSEAPTLSSSWIKEDERMVDRSLAVHSNVARQLIADIRCNMVMVRPMPVYSIPGLIDHH